MSSNLFSTHLRVASICSLRPFLEETAAHRGISRRSRTGTCWRSTRKHRTSTSLWLCCEVEPRATTMPILWAASFH